MKDTKTYNLINANLDIFSQINTYMEHSCNYEFICITRKESLMKSIERYFNDRIDLLQKTHSHSEINKITLYDDVNIYFEKEDDWQGKLKEVLNYRFLGVFNKLPESERRAFKHQHDEIKGKFISLMEDFLIDDIKQVYSSGANSCYSNMTPIWGECNSTDFMYETADSRIFILHFGVSD